jgi:hypothetical protein
MKKGFKTYAIAWAILLVLFNVIAFVSPGWTGVDKYTSSFWIGYVFITICFVGNLLCANSAFKADSARKLFYNVPLITISYTALIVSFVVGGLCMLLSNLSYWLCVIVCAAVLALFAIAIVKANAAADLVERVDDKVKSQTSFIRNMIAEAESLMNRAKSLEVKSACKQVYEALRYSNPMSNDALSVIEEKITMKVDEFSSAVGADDAEKSEEIAGEIVILVADRNKKCKGLK